MSLSHVRWVTLLQAVEEAVEEVLGRWQIGWTLPDTCTHVQRHMDSAGVVIVHSGKPNLLCMHHCLTSTTVARPEVGSGMHVHLNLKRDHGVDVDTHSLIVFSGGGIMM